jgi:MoxR-like ATPase
MAKSKAAAERVETIDEAPVSLIQQKFTTTLQEIIAALIERDDEVIMALVALICHEHMFLQGPPGTGKSLLADSIMSWFDGPTFSELMMKDLPSDAIFGPLDIPRLLGKKTGESEYFRLVPGYLPAARIAFFDETFKAGPAVLNRVLKIMNERKFLNGNQTINVPLITMLGASNEWPSDQDAGKELGALVDRFLLRKNIKPVSSHQGRQRLLFERDHTPKLSTRITEAELHQAKREALALPWNQKTKDVLVKILNALQGQGIIVGDRRQYKAVDCTAANAYLQGAKSVEPEHLEILQHVLWTDPNEQPKKAAEIVLKLANPVGAQIAQYLVEAQQILEEDLSDLGKLIQAKRKLDEVHTKLEQLKETEKQKQALTFIETEMENLSRTAMKKKLV